MNDVQSMKEWLHFNIIEFTLVALCSAVISGFVDWMLGRALAVTFVGATGAGIFFMVFELFVIYRGGSFPGLITTGCFGMGFGGSIVGIIMHSGKLTNEVGIIFLILPVALMLMYAVVVCAISFKKH